MFGFLVCLPLLSPAAVRTASTSGYWTNDTIWGTAPVPGDDAVIAGGVTVTTDVSTVTLGSLTNNGTLVFLGWNSTLTATNIAVSATGIITSGGPSPSAGPTNRVLLACTNINIAAGGKVDVTGKGWNGLATSAGVGPGGGTANATSPGAGGYGGRGGTGIGSAGGGTYGSASAPEALGSSGASWQSHVGGHGGGAIRIDAGGKVTVNGSILANGLGGGTSYGGGGSGGSILINCGSVVGSGLIQAAGGISAALGNYDDAGCGGGGRIAIVYDPTQQAAEPVKPTITFSAAGGMSPHSRQLLYFAPGWPGQVFSSSRGQSGTLYLVDTNFFPNTTTFTNGMQLAIPTFTNWSLANLTVSNAWVGFGNELRLDVVDTVTVMGAGGRLDLSDSTLSCGGDLILTNGGILCAEPSAPSVSATIAVGKNLVLTGVGTGFDVPLSSSLFVLSAATNGVSPEEDYGALLTVNGSIAIGSNTWVYPYANPTNGGAPLFRAGAVSIAAWGGIDAVGKGYAAGAGSLAGKGPARGGYQGDWGGGGGHGGVGSAGNGGGAGGAPTYGSSNAPVTAGSGGGGRVSGAGGGVVRIESPGKVTIDGALSADGRATSYVGGGGAGGSVYIRCKTFTGSGSVTARGSNGGTTYNPLTTGGAGGGGRIAIWRTRDTWSGTPLEYPSSVTNGVATQAGAQPGTLFWGYILQSGTFFVVH